MTVTRILFIAFIVSLACVNGSAQVAALPQNPTLKFEGLDGKVYDLAEQRGNVVLVSFGATWCTPCTKELLALGEVLNEYRGRPVKFFWVSIERPEEVSNSVLKRYANERKVAFPILRDDAQMVFSQFTTRVRLPLIVVIGKDGRIDAPVKFGMQSQVDVYKADIRARLNKLLALHLPSGRGIEGEDPKRVVNAVVPIFSQKDRD
jgi:peroxiredoxin